MKSSKYNFSLYNPELKAYARKNRASMTKAEACLWKYVLSNKQMMGYIFRRQRPVLNYIADFMCRELNLIIEVDGLTHQWEEVARNDDIREGRLKQAGFHVLRFSDEEVLSDIVNVIRAIEGFILDFEGK